MFSFSANISEHKPAILDTGIISKRHKVMLKYVVLLRNFDHYTQYFVSILVPG
jgi:hypothetical protein